MMGELEGAILMSLRNDASQKNVSGYLLYSSETGLATEKQKSKRPWPLIKSDER
jgi:hypothetical protein